MKEGNRQQGFSMIELLVVVAMVLALVAIATPTVFRAVRAYRLSAAASDVANIIQRTRFEAIKNNRRIQWRSRVLGNRQQIWIDLDGDQAVGTTEPFILLAPDVNFPDAQGAPATASMNLGVTQVPGTTGITFNGRGAVDGVAPATFVIRINSQTQSELGYRAISVTPAGRARIWRANPGQTTWR